jgi:hypothetical protein
MIFGMSLELEHGEKENLDEFVRIIEERRNDPEEVIKLLREGNSPVELENFEMLKKPEVLIRYFEDDIIMVLNLWEY